MDTIESRFNFHNSSTSFPSIPIGAGKVFLLTAACGDAQPFTGSAIIY